MNGHRVSIPRHASRASRGGSTNEADALSFGGARARVIVVIQRLDAAALGLVAVCFCLLGATRSAGDETTIDTILRERWEAASIPPPRRASDNEFLRRVTLDLAGRIPTLDELRAFRSEPDRQAAIERLLASDEFPRFWSEVWTSQWVGYANLFGSDREVLREWLEASLSNDVPYDRIVSRVIAAEGDSATMGPVNFLARYPEDPAVKVSRLFVGVRLDCARCHDHPFDRWKKDDLERMQRFFEVTRREELNQGRNVRMTSAPGNNADEAARPRFLTGAVPRTSRWRDELALFLTRSKPFARTYVNRVWYQLMGRGIVHPPDDFHPGNPPSVPRLLEYLSEDVRNRGFQLRPLVRAICLSDAYQQTSVREDVSLARETVFASRAVRPLTPEQTHDSLALALGWERNAVRRQELIMKMVGSALDEDFGETWAYRETVQELTSRLSGDVRVHGKSMDEVYSRILARPPTERERQLCQGQAGEDIVFALVNSNEFVFNH